MEQTDTLRLRIPFFTDKIFTMATSAHLGTILRHYATRQETAFISLRDFADYLRKYAAKHLEETPNLQQYLEIPEQTLLRELEDYQNRHEVYLINQANGKQLIVVITYFSVQFANRYKDIVRNITTPFPIFNDLPKQVPAEAIEKKEASSLISELQVHQDLKSPLMYCMLMPRDIPSILFPACVPVNFLIKASMAKLRHMLKKDEYHDYFQKKLRISNPGKEIAAQTFFGKFLSQNEAQDDVLDLSGDSFYFWNQLCYFIRQDFEKVKDRTAEDINVLQSVAISEIWMMNLKEKASKEQITKQALAELELSLSKPPFFYSMDGILKFTDSKGKLLYGQYSEEELKNFLQKLTTDCPNNELPRLLVFKIESGARYFIYKDKVFPLVIRLANEAHDTIEKNLTNKWFNTLSNYDKLPEMKDQKAFETVLKKEVQTNSPILHSILNANFLTMLHYEMDHASDASSFRIFQSGKLLPYSELLLLKNSTILANAKTMLPFWYTIPVISWIASLLHKKGKKSDDKSKLTSKELTSEDIPEEFSTSKVDKKVALAHAAKEISEYLVPAGSTLDRELDSYLKIWNKMITKEAHNSLTEDVNCLIRDYMRKVIKTVSAQTFTLDRVQSLAQTLVKTPNMQKIKEEEALTMYVQLYILRLVSNV